MTRIPRLFFGINAIVFDAAPALAVAALASFFLLSASPALCAKAPPPPAASLDEVTGDVTVLAAADGEEVDAEEDMELFEGDEVRTAKGAKVTVTFVDNHLVRLSERTRLKIKTVKVDPVKGSFFARLGLLTGRLFGSFTKLGTANSGLRVETRTAVAAVKGTTFAVEETDAESTVSVLEGTVTTAAVDEKGNEKEAVDVPAGSETTVNALQRKLLAPRGFLRDSKRQWLTKDLKDIQGSAGRFRALKASGQVDRLRRMRNLIRASELSQRLQQDPKALDSLSPGRRARVERFLKTHGNDARRSGPEMKAFLRANPALRERMARQAEMRMRGKGRGATERGDKDGLKEGGKTADTGGTAPAKPKKQGRIQKLKDRFKR